MEKVQGFSVPWYIKAMAFEKGVRIAEEIRTLCLLRGKSLAEAVDMARQAGLLAETMCLTRFLMLESN